MAGGTRHREGSCTESSTTCAHPVHTIALSADIYVTINIPQHHNAIILKCVIEGVYLLLSVAVKV